jgi:hypothetical protein
MLKMKKLLYKAPSGNMVSRQRMWQILQITQRRCCLLLQADLLRRLTAQLESKISSHSADPQIATATRSRPMMLAANIEEAQYIENPPRSKCCAAKVLQLQQQFESAVLLVSKRGKTAPIQCQDLSGP